MPRFSVISGTFNERENVEEFVTRVAAMFTSLGEADYELIIIDNASTDGTPERLRSLAAKDPRIKVILNTRNFGHIRSPFHALLQTTGDAVICLASDLQDPPEMIPAMVAKWQAGAKAVVCVKESEESAPLFALIRRTYYRIVHTLADTEIIENFTGFGLYDRAVVDYCRNADDPYPYFRGMISEIGFPVEQIPYQKPGRKRGVTKNNFYTLYDLAMLGITNHSKVPLRLATMVGFAMSLLSLIVGLVYLLYKLLFWQSFPLGMAPVVIGLFLFCSVQLFFIGILGEYIGAIHTHVAKRPLVVEKERINF
ncbi:MAG: glycosyltransferase family 2 protein [Terrimicrobiaceae bacterium]